MLDAARVIEARRLDGAMLLIHAAAIAAFYY